MNLCVVQVLCDYVKTYNVITVSYYFLCSTNVCGLNIAAYHTNTLVVAVYLNTWMTLRARIITLPWITYCGLSEEYSGRMVITAYYCTCYTAHPVETKSM